jgi:hypothetical protein
LEEIEKAGGLRLHGHSPYAYFQHVKKFVAEHQGGIVGEGFVMASRYNPIGSLESYHVEAGHRRKGLGGAILRRCIEHLRSQGLEAMFLDTGPSIAHSVYEKHGFQDLVPEYPEYMGWSFTPRPIRGWVETYFDVDLDHVEVRELDPSYLLDLLLLMNCTAPCPFAVKNYGLTLFSDDQMHEGQFLTEMPRLAGIGTPESVKALGVLANGRLVGFSTLAPFRIRQWNTRRESHIALWDVYFHPRHCSSQVLAVLLSPVKVAAEKAGIHRLRVVDAPDSNPKTEALQALGFRPEYVMKEAAIFADGSPHRGVYECVRLQDLAVYSLELGRPVTYEHPWRVPWDY